MTRPRQRPASRARLLPLVAALGLPFPAAFADEPAPSTPLALDTSRAIADEARAQGAGDKADPRAGAVTDDSAAATRRGRFGEAGTHWLTLGGGYANDFEEANDLNAKIGYSSFLADDLEFEVELNGWYFNQRGDNTGGINPVMNFRWHFWHTEDRDWTVYGEVGIGLLFAFDEVPDGGTGFDFTPRAGAGFTHRLTEDDIRLQVGVRWAHISNGRFQGDFNNPSRDSVMIYAGIIVPLP